MSVRVKLEVVGSILEEGLFRKHESQLCLELGKEASLLDGEEYCSWPLRWANKGSQPRKARVSQTGSDTGAQRNQVKLADTGSGRGTASSGAFCLHSDVTVSHKRLGAQLWHVQLWAVEKCRGRIHESRLLFRVTMERGCSLK